MADALGGEVPARQDAPPRRDRSRPAAAGRGKKEEGSVPAYMNARLQSAVGKTLTLAALHSDYQAWCRAEKLTALKRQVFAEVLSKTAGEVGLESANEGREKVWLDVELVG